MKKELCFLLLPIAALLSCKKDEGDAPVNTRTRLLTAKTWKLTAATIDPPAPLMGGPQVYSNVYALLDECETDNLLTYTAASANASSGTVTNDEGPTKCHATDPQTRTGNWAFNSDQTTITEPWETTPWLILELTDSIFRKSATQVSNGTSYTTTATYRAQ